MELSRVRRLRVEEDEADCFVTPDALVAVRVSLDFQGLLQQDVVVARVGEGGEVFHFGGVSQLKKNVMLSAAEASHVVKP